MAKRTAPKGPRRHEDRWACALCEEKPNFENTDAYLAHMQETHPERLDGAYLRAPRSKLLSSLDGRDWFRNTYSYVGNDGIEIAQREISGPRDEDDMMRYV